MATSILDSVKESLGLGVDYTPFDAELVTYINAVLSDLHQLGIGPIEGFEITAPVSGVAPKTWDDFLGPDPRLNNVKSYMQLRLKLMFDPPNVGYVLTAIEKQLEKLEWRINHGREEIAYPPPVPEPIVVVDQFGDLTG